MSVILITFSAAPQVSEDAIEKEQQLDKLIKERVEGIVKEKRKNITLAVVIEDLQNSDIQDLPPGGGLHSKLCLIEETLDQLMPNRAKEENRGVLSSLPLPLSMIRQIASEQSDMDTGEQGDKG